MSPEDLAFKVLGLAFASLPSVAELVRDAIAAGHGDPVTRAKVAAVLPELSESRKAQMALEAAAVPATVVAAEPPAVIEGPKP